MKTRKFLSTLEYRPRENSGKHRTHLLNIFIGGLMTLASLTLLVTSTYHPSSATGLSQTAGVQYLLLILTLVIGAITLALNRWVSLEIASSVFLVYLVIVISYASNVLRLTMGQILVMFTIPILGASVLLRAWAGFIFAGLSSFGILLAGTQPSEKYLNVLIIAILFALAVFAWLFERGAERADKWSRTSSARFRLIYGSMSELIALHELVYDSSGKAADYRILDCNPAFTHITGIDHKRAVGALASQLYKTGTAPYLATYAKVVETGEATHFETYFAPMEKYFNISAFSPEKGQFVTIATDVTEQKATQEALQNSSKRFRALIEKSTDAIILIDSLGMIKYMSPPYARMMGRDIAQRIGKSSFEHVHPDDKASVIQKFDECIRNPFGSRQATFRLQHQNGTWRWVELVATNLLDEPAIQGIVINMRDITEHKQAEEAIQRHLTELEALSENIASLNCLLDPKEIGQKIIEILSKKLAWHHAAIRLYHPEAKTVEVLALSHPGLGPAEIEKHASHLNRVISRLDEGLSGWVIEHGKPVRSGQVREDPRYIETYRGIQSGVYIPIMVGERAIGSIAVESETINAFTEQDENLLSTLASQAAVALENARLYQEAVQAAERRTILHCASQEIVAAGLNMEAVYTAVHQAAAKLMTVDVFTICLHDAARQETEAVFLWDDGQRYPNMRIPVGRGFSGWVIQNRQALLLRDRRKEMPGQAVSFGKKSGTRSVLAVPIFAGDAVIGAISVQSRRVDEYDEEDASLLEMLAAYAGIAIENARQFNQTQRRADELSILASVSSALRTSIKREEVVSVILDHIVTLFKADDAALSAHDPSTGENIVEQARGKWTSVIGTRLEPGEGIIESMAETRMPYQSDNITQEKNFHFSNSLKQPEAVAGTPLLVQGQFIGSLWVGRQQAKGEEKPVSFTSDEVQLLASIADVTANGLHRATLYEQTTHHAEQLVIVNEIGHMLGETLELDQIYSRLTGVIYDLVPDICGFFISLYEPQYGQIRLVCSHFNGKFINPNDLQPLPFDQNGKECQSRILLTDEPIISNDPDIRPLVGQASHSVDDSKQIVKSGLCVPMAARGTTIGLIKVISQTRGRFGQKDINLLSLVANTAAIAIENARLFAETQKRLHNLSALHTIDTAISASVDMHVTLSILLEQTVAELKVDAAAVLLYNSLTRTLEYVVSHGFRVHQVIGMRIPLGSGVAGQAALKRRLQNVSDPGGASSAAEGQKSVPNICEGEGFITHYAMPLIAKGQIQGVLEVFHRSAFHPDEEWLTFFDMLAGQAAITIDNGRLFGDLQRSNLDMVLAYDATIQGWSQALELRDKETQGHTLRVTDLTLRLAQAVGVPNAELEHVRRGALLHDIGKMGIPDSILLKPDKLTDEEWEIMRQHPGYAYEMLSPISYLRPALDIPYYHHERWDGSGYPNGLRGEQIPLYARIFAVVDVYDALTSDRPYRPPWTVEKTLEYIRENSGKLFDPKIVEVFLSLVPEEK